jgi:two-component system, OmpR family, sensor kinase
LKIRRKIALWVAGAGFLTSLALSLVVFLEMREQPFKIMDSDLSSTAADLAEFLSSEQKPFTEGRINALFLNGNEYWVKVYSRDLRPVCRSALAAVVDLPLFRDRGDDGYIVRAYVPRQIARLQQDRRDEVHFRVRVMQAQIRGAPYLIQIARPMEGLEKEIGDLETGLGMGLAVSALLLVIVSYVFAGRIVRPVAEINRLTKEINENTLGKRIPLGASRDELYELSASLNRMFDRLQYSFAKQKQFLADASHELKSPVTMLRLFFDDGAQCQDLPKAFHRRLISQADIVLRMDRLVKNLLELSVLELKGSLAPEEFSLRDLIQSVVEDFSLILTEAKIRLEIHLPENLKMIGDKDKIRRMLINILDNAIKYNVEDGEIKLELSEKEGSVCISLFNTGPGIPKDERERVFEQFYRVEKSRSLQYGGAGLGLAIVKQIVRLHCGKVSLESEPGAWTRIDVTLPQHPGS